MTELLELRGVVEAAPDVVAAVLLDVGPGGRSPLTVSGTVERGGGDAFVVVREGSRITVTVDRAVRSVTQQGEWWYRGVTSVEPDPRGSVVVHRVFNIALGHRWAVRMVSRGPLIAAPTAFATQLELLSGVLGVAAWVIPD
ncbi:hypothetical protein QLQ12_14490 [Actinoplanes sp. NEAU-A12]|uniref:Uncharacterized protein n=1 Tax=Actinoplanes sandaracinus TaxID=3045177 RepID=A0ABT6WJA6_9ACTN|nr:hypothetical protein [Actinoplanes sandaracinus]MDI6099807.1 hypothetical protein [Actinoplanes sandaracinus]